MKTFGEFVGKTGLPAKSSSVPSFKEVMEGEGKTSCISESMHEKLNEMYEAMCEDMKTCHEDETERTAENYMKDCESKMMEIMEGLKKCCDDCMIKQG
jgi:hypothetical protein